MPEAENNINITPEENGKDDSKKVYELGYLFVPTIAEENAPALFGNLKEQIESLGGEIISSEMPRMMHLAYVMSKVITNVRHRFDTAYFGWIKFDMEADKLATLKKQLDSNPDLIRFLITKTVRENTLAPKRYAGSSAGRPRMAPERREEKDAAPIDKVEIDKEIDALVEEA
ncbi:MAG TPA: 30S ribosomal protein S6 [Candidatus Paceibacterota bacterium]|nr:30S ribosomal protein S6 [Candidatus Paceibacterota bacterium]